jgi:V8-like Glu-specific endopeptidase
VWRLTLTSADAEAMRVHFQDFHVGDGNVWLLGPDDAATTTGPYSKDGLLGDGEFWSDLVEGDSLTVLYEPADDSAVDTVPFWPSEIAHRFPSMIAKASSTQSAAASCNVDVTCHPEYADAASAVALMVFESNDGTYECTGSLVSSASKPALPFFLTANHCISTAAEARSLITFFNYQTSSCNGTKPTLSNSARVTGATFVDGQDMSLGDFTLLRLTAFPNIDVKVLGWTGDEIASNEQVTGISHPLGDYKRIALGQRTRDVSIRFSDGARMPANKGYQVAWFEGVTQGGSSGSPLLVNVNGKTYVAGTLSAGPDVNEDNSAQVCRASNLIASYGRFSAALPYLESYLRSVDGAVSMSSTPSITATPVTSGGRTTLTWQANGPTQVQIRVGSPTGPAMTGLESPIGSAQTGDWAVDGMIFYLQDASDGNSLGAAKTLASVRAQAAIAEIKDGAITASPNPIRVAAGQTRGATTLNWRATGVRQVQIRVGSPTGSPMTGFESVTGSTSTGNWVTNGLTFYLQDASDGNSAGSAKTLATIRVTLSNR